MCDTALVKRTVQTVYDELHSCEDLQPCTHVNRLFGQLVQLAVACPCHHSPTALEDPSISTLQPQLWALCAEGEQQLELSWAKRIATSPTPHHELRRFPYLPNYQRLTQLEVDALASVGALPARRVAFIGAGPLPLSALLLADQMDAHVDCFDRDIQAIALARRVTDALGATLAFHHADASNINLTDYDLVVLAALVGRTAPHKSQILSHLAGSMSAGTILLARSARGMRTLLYPSIDTAHLVCGFTILTTVHPHNDVINSAIVAQRTG